MVLIYTYKHDWRMEIVVVLEIIEKVKVLIDFVVNSYTFRIF